MSTTENNYALESAKASLDSIVRMIAFQDYDAIQEDPLEVTTYSELEQQSWDEEAEHDRFLILLSYGGPSVRIIGKLDRHKQPSRPVIQYQDWGTPWTPYHGNRSQQEALQAYVEQFYYGE